MVWVSENCEHRLAVGFSGPWTLVAANSVAVRFIDGEIVAFRAEKMFVVLIHHQSTDLHTAPSPSKTK